jgi:hypothetical protein
VLSDAFPLKQVVDADGVPVSVSFPHFYNR